jgi:hypothetical protein
LEEYFCLLASSSSSSSSCSRVVLYLEMPGAQVPITIEQLVALNPYNPDILPDLENYVEEQVCMYFICFFLFFPPLFVTLLPDEKTSCWSRRLSL